MSKRRRLSKGDNVVLIYDVNIGFIQQAAVFIEYRKIQYKNVQHEIPVFQRQGSEITGIECFWLLLSDLDDDLRIEQFQRRLIDLQLVALEVGDQLQFEVPEKIRDKEIRKMAKEKAEFRAELVSKLGYDPLDYSWVERELAETPIERQWFKFQRNNKGSFDDQWDITVQKFKDASGQEITAEEAFDLSRKWKRYLIGAWNTITAQNPNIEDWKAAARKFEKHHRDIETRMMQWSMTHRTKYPLVEVKEPIDFQHGPYFNECVERVPHLFTDAKCSQIQPGVILQVTSYDPEHKYIRLDFTPEIQEKIRPGIPPNDPWRPLRSDYIIYVPPEEVDERLKFLGSLE